MEYHQKQRLIEHFRAAGHGFASGFVMAATPVLAVASYHNLMSGHFEKVAACLISIPPSLMAPKFFMPHGWELSKPGTVAGAVAGGSSMLALGLYLLSYSR